MKLNNIVRMLPCLPAAVTSLAISVAMPARVGAEVPAAPRVMPINSSAYGKSYQQWAAAWWEWALALPVEGHPLFDQTGDNAAAGQSGPVWFLAGVINESGTATRQATVPAGKALFFPVLNVECSSVEPPPFFGASEAEQQACAASFALGNLVCEIDDVPMTGLADYYVISPQFEFALPENNILGVPGPLSGTGAAAGVHLMITPLSVGQHKVHFSGTFLDYDFTVDITYQLTVK